MSCVLFAGTLGAVVLGGGTAEALTNSAPAITSSSSYSVTQGDSANFTVTTTGSPAPSLSETGALPNAITLTNNGNGTASLSGSATISGTNHITITASNGVLPNATQHFTLKVTPPVTTWTHQNPITDPGAFGAASLAYDSSTSQLVMFGGTTGTNTYVNGTWTWNGTNWTQLSTPTSLSARSNAAMAYDASTGQLLLFGGVGPGATYLNDTWSWNGTTWTQLSPATSPPVRSNASMAYDPATSQLILFGGEGNSTATGADTWSWNGTTWTQLSPVTSPSARYRASIAYDPATSQLVLFGGTSNSTATQLADTWTWSGTYWTQLLPVTSPSARGYGALVFDATTDQLILFGGIGTTSNDLGDTWNWNGTTWNRLSPTTSPSARYRSAAAYDPATSQLLLYGGNSGSTYLGDTWTYGLLVPAAPTVGSATAGNQQATVSFTPPASNGGPPVTSYIVTATDVTTPTNGGETIIGSASPLTVTGLTNGDTYVFAVAATNSDGTGPASQASNAVVPAPPITITSVTPDDLVPGTTGVDVVIDGSDFVSPLSVTIAGGGGITPSLVSVSATSVTIKVNVDQSAIPGARNVTVADINGTVTCTGCLTITPASTLTSATPDTVADGATASVTFSGSGFETGATVKITGPSTGVTASNASVVDATTLTANITVPAAAITGAYTVTITNPDLTSASCSNCLSVVSASANPTYSVTPTNPQAAQFSTVASPALGYSTYTASGFTAGQLVNIDLFPTSADAPTFNAKTGAPTFVPNGSGNAAGQGATNDAPVLGACIAGATCTGYIASVNGVPELSAATAATNVAANSSGDVTFIVNADVVDGTTPVVFTGPTTTLAVNSNGTPATGYEVGIAGSTTWGPPTPAAGSNTYPGEIVQTVNATAQTFTACTVPGPGFTATECNTFSYATTGDTFTYDEGSVPGVSEANFAAYLSGELPAYDAGGGAFVEGDELNIDNSLIGPSSFTFVRDVPASPTAVTTSVNGAGNVTVSWTAPVNPDNYSYTVLRASVPTSGIPTAFAAVVETGNPILGSTPADMLTPGAVPPATTFTDTTVVAGTTYEYEVVATPDNPNGGGAASSAPSLPSAQVTPPTSATAAFAPLSTATGFNLGTGNTTDTLQNGNTLTVNFNTPVTVAPTAFSLTVTDGSNVSTLTPLNSTLAAASPTSVLYTITAPSIPGTPHPIVFSAAQPLEVINQTGVSNSVGMVHTLQCSTERLPPWRPRLPAQWRRHRSSWPTR
jgi:hypothetical protein